MGRTSAVNVRRLRGLEGPTLSVDSSVLIEGQPHDPHPCPAFLIDHPAGLVLWDTGLYPPAAHDPIGAYGQKLIDFVGLEFAPHQTVEAQLALLGMSVDDIDVAIISHLHFDHVGGLHLFPRAEVYLGAGELAYAQSPAQEHAFLYRSDDVQQVSMRKTTTVDHDLDLFGDESVTILRTPGHTPGQLSLLVRTEEGPVILSGDTIHTREALTTLEPLSVDVDKEQAVASIVRLATLAEEQDAAIWIAHDPRDWKKFHTT